MRKTLKTAMLALAAIGTAGSANALLIDDFLDAGAAALDASIEPSSTTPADTGVFTRTSSNTVQSGSDFIGINRTYTVTRDNDDSQILITSPFNGSQAQYNKGADNDATGNIGFDGGSLASGFDFTANGDDVFTLGVDENSIPIQIALMLTDSANVMETIFFQAVGGVPLDGTARACSTPNSFAADQIGNTPSGSPINCFIPFDDFATVDLTSVTNINILISETQRTGGALVLDFVGTDNVVADPVVPVDVPAPAGIFLVAAGLLGMRRFRK